MIAAPVAAKRIVGRVAERAFFDARLDAARGGAGAVVLVLGEAGSGKTRLQEAWLEAAAARGARTARAVAVSYAAAAFAPLADALRALIERDRRSLPADPEARALLEQFLDRLAPGARHYEPWHKRRVFVVVGELLERLAQRGPVVVAIDDLHAADPESLEMLQYLAAQCGGHGIVLVLAARPDETDASRAHAAAVAALERHAWSYRLALGPLSQAEVRELVFAALPPDGALGGRVVEEICRRSGGHPLFAEDLVRAALYGPEREAALPHSVEQSVRQRLDELSADEVAALEIAAALGPSFDLARLAGIAGIAPAAAARALRRGRELNVLAEADASGALRFRHELIRDAVYRRMLVAERRLLHERIARWLESAEPDADPAALAYHWNGAGDADRAAEYALRAAAHDFDLCAFASARDQLEPALASARLAPERRAAALELLGRAHDLLGDAAAAYGRFREALALRGAPDARADAARLSLRLANAAFRVVDLDTALQHCRDALAACAHDDPVHFSAHVLLGTFLAAQGELDAAARQLDEADALAVERDPGYVVRYHLARATVHGYARAFDAWREAALASVHAAEAYGDPGLSANCWLNLGGFAGEQADFALADEALAHAIALGDAYALSYSGAYARIVAANLARLRGDLPRAHALLQAACALGVEAPVVRVYAAAVGIPIALDAGDRELAERLAEPELLAVAERSHRAHFALLAAAHVELRAARGEGEAARALCASSLGALRGSGYGGAALLTFARHGTRADAARAGELLAAAPAGGNAFTPLFAHLVAALGARGAQRTNSAALARELARRLGAPLLEALACELGGERERALALYRAAGAARELRRLESERAPAAPRGAGPLTRREGEIAKLVAAGLSNRDIAAQLVLSERTVEHHVAAALGKLGFRSRAELAAHAALSARSAEPSP